jgi:opacity protein-like surface antigen
MMPRLLHALILSTAVVLMPATALAQAGGGQIQGFGGLTMRGVNPSPTFGGSLAVPIGNNIQVLAEGGRMSDVISGPLSTLIDFSPIDLRVSAYYGEAGVRVLGSANRVIRPYAEGTVGMARLHTNVSGLGGTADLLTNAALGFLNSTQPVFGGGAGVQIQGGPMLVDLGYRYHRFGSGNVVQNALTGGAMNVHQLRMGVGIRF